MSCKIAMALGITYFLEENLIEVDDAEQILSAVVSSIYQFQHFDQGKRKQEILDVIESHRQFLLKEMRV